MRRNLLYFCFVLAGLFMPVETAAELKVENVSGSPVLEVSSGNLTHGGIFVVSTSAKEAGSVRIKASVFPLYSGKDKKNSGVIIAVPIWWKSGVAYEVFLGGEPTGVSLAVFDRISKKEILTVEKSKLVKNEETEKQFDILFGAITGLIDKKYWSGIFLKPVNGRITTEYGTGRTLNGVSGRIHKGVDIAAPLGTEVKASNDGLVTLSRNYFSTGNTVVINHGTGIVSVYYHMDELLVKENSRVLKGQVIGKVGSTGVSTGAHLHFGIWIFGVDADPLELIDRDLEY